MFSFLSGPRLGLEITSQALRLGVLARKNGALSLGASKVVPLPAGLVAENYQSLNIKDPAAFTALLTQALRDVPVKTRRIGLSLPDSIFRVQMLEFDDLPEKTADRDRVVRWRLEKGAAFDISNTVLRYQAVKRPEKGVSVLACVAKKDVLSQYEDLITSAGYEVWELGLSSLNALNFFQPALRAKRVFGFALVWITETSYATIVVEQGGPRFYRYKEIKPGAPTDIKDRLMREIDDALHFYMHLDRHQPSELGHLFLAGDAGVLTLLADGLKGSMSFDIEVLDPRSSAAIGMQQGMDALAAALGAGGAL